MAPKDIVLNIAVNLGRLARWAQEGKKARMRQFIADTDSYVALLEKSQKNQKFEKTFKAFKKKYELMKKEIRLDDVWAEDALTWANILTHRAKLA